MPEAKQCVFCEIIAGRLEAAVVFDDDDFVAFLDRRPVFLGHVLVVPRRHVVTLPELPEELVGPLFSRVKLMSAAVPVALGMEGTFVALNNVVSQSVPHLHVHVVPRRKDDGLKGFFWPRTRYESEAQLEEFRSRLASAISGQSPKGA